jgi:hypothetical protein
MLVREVCTQLSLTFKLESMRLLKVERRYLAVNIVGQTVFWWNSQRTLIPAVSHSWFMFHVHTLLVYVIFSVEITTCPPLWPITLCWKLWFRLGPIDLYCSWMKSNGIHIMVLDTWLIKQWCGRRNVLEGVLDTLWRWTVSNWLVPNEWRSIQNTWRIDIIYVAQNVTKPATMLRQRGYYIVYIYIAFCLVFWHLVLYIPFSSFICILHFASFMYTYYSYLCWLFCWLFARWHITHSWSRRTSNIIELHVSRTGRYLEAFF